MTKKNLNIFLFLITTSISLTAQEVIFADYFDIKTNQPASTLVTGKIHLKRNKDVLTNAIPASYKFEITSDPSGLFSLTSKRENIYKMQGLLIGEFRVKTGKTTPSIETDYNLTIALKNGTTTLVTKEITIKVVTKTMLEFFVEYYKPKSLNESRLYGRKRFDNNSSGDAEIQAFIDEINTNNGELKSINDVFETAPENIDKLNNQWYEVARHIGALGYAYADTSSSYYKSEILRKAIYKSARAYMDRVPVFSDDISSPYGSYTGDGYQGLNVNGAHLSFGDVTHQWVPVDPLGVPLVHVLEEMLADIETGDPDAIALKQSIVRFYQIFTSVVPVRRAMNNDSQRWRDISNDNYSNGAWSDANIAHRMRSLMVMGVVWADYNRPITYASYWYDDFYDGTEFEGKTFAKGWSPNGIVNDLRYWCTKLSDNSKMYNQSGFLPDGTITHHIGHGASDVAMFAYGFEWLDEINVAIGYFKNTPFPIEDKSYQFYADRIDYTYRRMIYKQQLDFVVSGRSYYADMTNLPTKQIKNGINDLIDGKSPTTIITNESELIELNNNIQSNTHTHNESIAFWNADYLIHRRENNDENYYFSVKQKSSRTSGAEDFDKIRKSWHAGSGVFQLKVDGDEYAQNVLQGYDWHVLPGVTEEWRTDPMPTGPASDAGPGLNEYSGILANGNLATSAFLYEPTPSNDTSLSGAKRKLDELPQYASANAYKSYHMIGAFGTALGSNIMRIDNGQSQNIVTCIDQSKHTSPIYYSINEESTISLSNTNNHNLQLTLTGPTWVFHKNKGYLIFPKPDQTLFIKTGSNINVTDTNISSSSNYILALDHGVNPNASSLDGYHYVLVANATLSEMPLILEEYSTNYLVSQQPGISHSVYDTLNKVVEASFFEPSTIFLNNDNSDWIKANKPAIIIREELEQSIKLSVVDPLHDLQSTSVTIELPQVLKPGNYDYNFEGITTINGETASVTHINEGSRITINLPDSSDDGKYDYREALLAGAPLSIEIPKSDLAGIDEPQGNSKNNIKIYPTPITENTVVEVLKEGEYIHRILYRNHQGQVIYRELFDIPIKKTVLPSKRVNKPFFITIYTNKGVYTRMLI